MSYVRLRDEIRDERNEPQPRNQRSNSRNRRSRSEESLVAPDPVNARPRTADGTRDIGAGIATPTPADEVPRDPNALYGVLPDGFSRIVGLIGGTGDTMEVNLTPFEINRPCEFEALSYVWGPKEDTMPIRVLHNNMPRTVQKTRNLYGALRHLRPMEETSVRYLWVDALSINQDDVPEKTRQVRLMDKIYRAAKNICVWLGGESEDSDAAMDFIPKILDLRNVSRLASDRNYSSQWFALVKLMERSWFTRRWVIQETALAKDITIYCGSRSESWTNFFRAASVLQERWSELALNLSFAELPPQGIAPLARIKSEGINVVRESVQKRLDLEYLLAYLPMFESTNPHDTVYALLALARDGNNIDIDYDLGLEDLLTKVVDQTIRKSESLDIICRPWAPIAQPDQPYITFPSWIPTVSQCAYVRHPNGQYDRENADSLVGVPRNCSYSASGKEKVHTHRYNIWKSERNFYMLSTSGFSIGTITEVGIPCHRDNIPAEWMAMSGWEDRTANVPDSFWRTLVGGRGPNLAEMACETAFRQANGSFISVTTLLQRNSSTDVADFLRRVQATIWNRVLVKVEKDGENNTSLVPTRSMQGDVVHILFGCNVPVVLRYSEGHYTLIGECYMHGFMHGEAMQGLREGKYRRKTLKIR